MSDSFETSYAIHTASCTFLLDSEGICRRVVVNPSSMRNVQSKIEEVNRLAARCVGAQYLASLDPMTSGMLAEMPRVGAAMLFAQVDARGRVSLVRTGPVTQFAMHRNEHPFQETDDPLSASVETSAPPIPPSSAPPRMFRNAFAPIDPYGDETNDCTRHVPGARHRLAVAADAEAIRGDDDLEVDDETLEWWRSEYPSNPKRRPTWSSPPGAALSPPAATFRNLNAIARPNDAHARHAAAVREPLPRPSTPPPPRTRSDRVQRYADLTPRMPRAAHPSEKTAGRRRGSR